MRIYIQVFRIRSLCQKCQPKTAKKNLFSLKTQIWNHIQSYDEINWKKERYKSFLIGLSSLNKKKTTKFKISVLLKNSVNLKEMTRIHSFQCGSRIRIRICIKIKWILSIDIYIYILEWICVQVSLCRNYPSLMVLLPTLISLINGSHSSIRSSQVKFIHLMFFFIYSSFHFFILSSFHLFIHLVIFWYTHLFIMIVLFHLIIIHSFNNWFIHSKIYSFIQDFIRSFNN